MSRTRGTVTRYRQGWRARYRDDAGKQIERHFPRKVDAERFLDEVMASRVTGMYVHPDAGSITVHDFAEKWRATRQHRPSTARQVQGHFTRYLYPALGDRRLDSIRPSDIDALMASALTRISPATAVVLFRYTSAMFTGAVRDKRLPESPMKGMKAPKVNREEVVPPTLETVERIRLAVPERYRAIIVVGAGLGLRQAEAFGLTVDRIDFKNRRVRIDRQLGSVSNERPEFSALKTYTSTRTLSLPVSVSDALIEHMAAFPPGPDGLVFTNTYGAPLRRSSFNTMLARSLKAAGIERVTFHGFRHFHASLLIEQGASVKTVQKRLGHYSATETLDTYAHLWPDADDSVNEAVDAVLGMPSLESRVGQVWGNSQSPERSPR